MRKLSPVMVCSCVFFCCTLASVSSGSTGVRDPISQPSNGQLTVAVHTADGWVEAGSPAFGKHLAERVIDLSNHEIPVPLRVRVSHGGVTAAHIDSILIDGSGPVEVEGASEGIPLAVIKAGRTDNDLIDVQGRSLVFVFDGVSVAGRLGLTARIEPVRISKVPFHFPPDNLYDRIDEASIFYPYALDSHEGQLDVNGSLESEGLGEPFFKAYSTTGTGHPSDYTYGWVRNDDENLYVALDFVPDNTMDGAEDYARVYVNTSSGIRRYQVSVPDQRWGMPGFEYTSRAAYQHKVYEFSIPLDDLGAHSGSTASQLELAFAAYGTAGPATVDIQVGMTESVDPVVAGSGAGNLVYIVTVTNNGPSDASGLALSEVLTLPVGVTVDSITPSGSTTFSDPTWTVGNLAISSSETLTVTLTVGPLAAAGTDVVSNTAAVTSAVETLINIGNDSATESSSVVREVDLMVSKTESIDPVVAGSGPGNLTYVVTVTNNGASDASGIDLSEVLTLPAGVAVDSITPSGTTTFSDPTWTVGNLSAGASETLTVVMTVGGSTATGTDIISNTATVTSAVETLINIGNDSATESTSVIRLDDFGDAPDTYGTLLANNGARHAMVVGISLGPIVDSEPDGQPTALADGDDLNPGAPDDEDGVILPPSLVPGVANSVTVDGGPAGGMLDGWIDFNGNGVFDHPAEHLGAGTSQAVVPGPNPLSFAVPADAVPGLTYARFRLSIAGLLPPTGVAPEGEVEDYPATIALPAPGTIIIEKQTNPDGSVQSFEFSSDYSPNFTLADDETHNSGPLTPGTYAVSEVNLPAGWSLTSATCDDGSDPSAIALSPGETVACTFTNSGALGVIIVEKQTDPDGSVESFEFSTDYGPNFTLADDETHNSGPLTPGTYAVSEVNLPAGWSLTSATCDDGSDPSAIALSPGETVACTFTNSGALGVIIVEKQTDPDGSVESFEFSTDYGPNFTLSDDETNNSGPLAPGTYAVSEVNLPAGWSLTSATCDDGSDPSAIGLDSGETVICTFDNTQAIGTIIIEKQTTPDGSAQSFEFSTDYGANFTLSDNQTNNSGPLAPGTYAVSEVNLPAGWSLTNATCDDGSDPSAIGLEVDETVTCVFNNSALDSDGDRILDIDEGLPGDDRDGDGVPNYLDFDPTGYLYDEATGQILVGGSISVTGPGVITVVDYGSATGQYSWFHDGTQGDYTVTVTYPPGYLASAACPDLGVLNPDATPDPLSLGAGENGSTGFLTSWDCGSNSYYSVLRVDATNPANIINNNIPMAPLTAIPTLSDRGVMMSLLLLLVSGMLILRRKF